MRPTVPDVPWVVVKDVDQHKQNDDGVLGIVTVVLMDRWVVESLMPVKCGSLNASFSPFIKL
jgi:hypothetical protein